MANENQKHFENKMFQELQDIVKADKISPQDRPPPLPNRNVADYTEIQRPLLQLDIPMLGTNNIVDNSEKVWLQDNAKENTVITQDGLSFSPRNVELESEQSQGLAENIKILPTMPVQFDMPMLGANQSAGNWLQDNVKENTVITQDGLSFSPRNVELESEQSQGLAEIIKILPTMHVQSDMPMLGANQTAGNKHELDDTLPCLPYMPSPPRSNTSSPTDDGKLNEKINEMFEKLPPEGPICVGFDETPGECPLGQFNTDHCQPFPTWEKIAEGVWKGLYEGNDAVLKCVVIHPSLEKEQRMEPVIHHGLEHENIVKLYKSWSDYSVGNDDEDCLSWLQAVHLRTLEHLQQETDSKENETNGVVSRISSDDDYYDAEENTWLRCKNLDEQLSPQNPTGKNPCDHETQLHFPFEEGPVSRVVTSKSESLDGCQGGRQESPYCIYMLMEYGGDTLEEWLKGPRDSTNSEINFHIFSQIVEAVVYLHTQKIVHRDLVTRNIYLKKKLHVKVGDFGSAKLLDCDTTDDFKEDMQMLGAILFQLFSSNIADKSILMKAVQLQNGEVGAWIDHFKPPYVATLIVMLVKEKRSASDVQRQILGEQTRRERELNGRQDTSPHGHFAQTLRP